jgi:hypothetical protein
MNDVVDGGGARGSGMVQRVKSILFTPAEEWPKIEAESTSIQDVLVRYVLPLAAIGPVAGFIGSQVFGYGAMGITYRPSFMSALGSAVMTYVLTVVGVFVLALIADALAPKFGGTSDRLRAFKLVAYSYTAAMIAGVFSLIPSLAFLGLLGLYSIYLFYTGTAPLMKVPQDKGVAYTAVTMVAAIVIYLVVGAIAGALVGSMIAGPTYVSRDAGSVDGTLTVPGVGSLDLGKAQQVADDMEAAASGKRPAVDPAQLRELLPGAIGGYQRTAIETGAMGGVGSEARATYASGDHTFELKITDMNALGALAGIGSAMNMQSSREDAEGYARTGTVDGQMQTEEWNIARSHGKFGRMIDNRFMVEAQGNAASMDELRAAVGAVDTGALTGLVS